MKKLLFLIPAILLAFTSKYWQRNIGIKCDVLLHKKAFDICYSCTDKHPLAVVYDLYGDLVDKNSYSREDLRFRPDYNLPRKCRSYPSDYSRSGFDRGHNAPNAAFDYNRTVQKETFLMSNISPQAKWLNRKYWAKVERFVRYLAVKYKKVEVITGSCKAFKFTLGKHHIGVPMWWYKIIHIPKINKTIAFLVPNINKGMKKAKLKKYLVPLDEVERVCKIKVW